MIMSYHVSSTPGWSHCKILSLSFMKWLTGSVIQVIITKPNSANCGSCYEQCFVCWHIYSNTQNSPAAPAIGRTGYISGIRRRCLSGFILGRVFELFSRLSQSRLAKSFTISSCEFATANCAGKLPGLAMIHQAKGCNYNYIWVLVY